MNERIADCDETHDPARESFLASARSADLFPIQNLPLGVCAERGTRSTEQWIGTLVDGQVVNLSAAVEGGLLDAPFSGRDGTRSLAPFMGCSAAERRGIRKAISALLVRGTGAEKAIRELMVPVDGVTCGLPAAIGDYTDFYASIVHARKVGSLFRPDEPLLPNYKHVPIAYHGRSSSIVAGDVEVRRPAGQRRSPGAELPVYGPSLQLDFELELGAFVGPGNLLGEPVPISRAAEQLAGFVLLNDWSARDIQSWEYQPLGPFLGKNFLTSISPWVITTDALAPFFTLSGGREEGDPPVLEYLGPGSAAASRRLDIELEVELRSRVMRQQNTAPLRVSQVRSSSLYWSFEQLVAHHTVNGCNLRPGDLLGSGTISGNGPESRGCLLERTERGNSPLSLPDGSVRSFLEDGDEVVFRGVARRQGFRTIGFGELRGTVGGGAPFR